MLFLNTRKIIEPVMVAVISVAMMGCVSGKAITKKEYANTIEKAVNADFLYGEYPQLSSCFSENSGKLKKSLDQSIDQCRKSQLAKVSDSEMLSAAAQQNFTKRVTKCGLFDYLQNHRDSYKGNQDGNCKLVSNMYRNIIRKNVDVF
ncbi:hypothetical protein BTA51_05215 [Hahella sp. CCB-MM4]|uniref:hypothetical protein n=1 Tax=Hahella sp. (strain CCB-MM4) TaxID=1926491 RepID=UPI000B9AA262|nr:hypothetical protein [Hahella sp. CCB-MM4]OZG74410.1 hypothetical protein BTA51_05215 [Hahella sp. CCB-MM4]